MKHYLSPAKINLFLRVIKRREDGFHELSSLFQTINLFDTLTIELSSDQTDLLTVNDPAIPTDQSNLILKASTLFRSKTGITSYFNIHLDKKIPMEAGLGGGSSNAATTLWALNEMCGNIVTTDQLIDWSAEIGSDVAFFLSEGTALCTGRGEKITPLSPLHSRLGWIVKPNFGLSTPAVYKNLDLSSLKQRNPYEALQQIQKGKLDYFNDLEQSAFVLSPAMEKLKNELVECGYQTVMMTGSGSAIVCIGEQKPLHRDTLFVTPFEFINRQKNCWYLPVK